MSELQAFQNAEFGEVRVVEVEGVPYFVGKDVATILGYSNSRKALIDHVDTDDKGVTNCDTLGGSQKLTVINESGLYSLILSSKLPTAKKFKRWVTSEVLPTIRKHGMYATEELLNNPDFLIATFTALKKEKEKNKELQENNDRQCEMINELLPQADYCSVTLKSKSLLTITQIAKDYGMSGNRLNEILHRLKVQYKQRGQWLLYAKYQDKGYVQSNTMNIQHMDGTVSSLQETKWTQKGKMFIYELLKKRNIVPVVERV